MKNRSMLKIWLLSLAVILAAACQEKLSRNELEEITGSGAQAAGGTLGEIGGMLAGTGTPGVVGGMLAALSGGSAGVAANSGGSGGSAGATPLGSCLPVRAYERLNARPPTMTANPVPRATSILTDQVFAEFSAQCGGCHVKQNLGGFQVNRGTFASVFKNGIAMRSGKKMDQAVVDVIRSDTPTEVMPPTPTLWTTRKDNPNDPVRQLVELLEAWIAAGKPDDLFFKEPPASSAGTQFLVSQDVGSSMTNIGNCVPEVALVAREVVESDRMDALFEAAQANTYPDKTDGRNLGLPLLLSATDLFTLDSAELARHGVLAYSPTYPLWTEDAGKLRYIRVPRGQTIRYDAATREFEIPRNTRFYKTFLKEVRDETGQKSFRKIETRVIVSRADDCSGAECKETALFGTYVWNPEETEAVLLTTPLRSLEPFADKLITYVTDEKAALEAEQLTGAAQEAALKKVTRHYAIPGKQRCIDCHMGSPSASFILAFTPLQVHRRPFVPQDEPVWENSPPGPGGVLCNSSFSGPIDKMCARAADAVIDPQAPPSTTPRLRLKRPEELVGSGIFKEYAPGADELTQLQRFIDYGLITGLKSADEVPSLRESQRVLPRNIYELKAQAYMLGNCAHCHNPKGLATVRNPQLAPYLKFFPSLTGGIFGFQLDFLEGGDALPFASPRLRRGPAAAPSDAVSFNRRESPIPYISPSLADMETQTGFGAGDGYKAKHYISILEAPDASERAFADVKAPWRSLIYRNVDAPFSYEENGVIYPRMPRHNPGHDCRAPRILGSWMVSIPSVWTARQKAEGAKAVQARAPERFGLLNEVTNVPQPYTEVLPYQSRYPEALDRAADRLFQYQSGERYQFCPDTSDIVDPRVTGAIGAITPPDEGAPLFSDKTGADQGGPLPFLDGVPDRPHFVPLDLTETAGAWTPRRGPEWRDYVLLKDPAKVAARPPPEQNVLNTLQNVSIDDSLKAMAVKPLPFAFWQKTPKGKLEAGSVEALKECPGLADQPLGSTFVGDARPRWFLADPKTDQQRIYLQRPGEAVFNMICANCHGPKGDGTGDLAAAIGEMTGGDSVPANLREGILLPANQARVFGPDAALLGITGEQLASRYLAWMALGGTTKLIPLPILDLVARTPVAGTARSIVGAGAVVPSSNMLQTAENLCRYSLAVIQGENSIGVEAVPFDYQYGAVDADASTALAKQNLRVIITNGDRELWELVCTHNNPAPVRIIDLFGSTSRTLQFKSTAPQFNGGALDKLYRRAAYPAGALVGTHRGKIETVPVSGISPSNLLPWCIAVTDAAGNPLRKDVNKMDITVKRPDPNNPGLLVEVKVTLEEYIRELKLYQINGQAPLCPPAFLAPANMWREAELDQWAVRGAMNAGFSVFAYLSKVSSGEITPMPPVNSCNLLPTP